MPDVNKEKAIRLIEYISNLASIRTKQVKNIDEYDNVLWLHDIPNVSACFTQMWQNEREIDPDVWIEISNKKEPKLPPVPDVCKKWLDYSILKDKDNIPLLDFQKAQLDDIEFDNNDGDSIDVSFINQTWDEFIDVYWYKWRDEHDTWQKINKVYTLLFSIHQAQLKLGEEYELVLGLGLLTWLTPTNQRIKRHLIVANVQLEFESQRAKFIVKPSFDGPKLRTEVDMLDLQYQPISLLEQIKVELDEIEYNIWDNDTIISVLEKFAHSITSNGEFRNKSRDLTDNYSENPIVDYAPAIILRKRSTQGLIAILEQIKSLIASGEKIPNELMDLAEVKADNIEIDINNYSDNDNAYSFDEVYFPKPSNEEQRRIIDRFNYSGGMLVQGPPGTGKSHTIANLICHLLATGQRILITAKTPRALTVLEGLIPDEIRPLCINLLGSGLQEKQSLERSINGVLRKRNEWIEQDAKDRIDVLKKLIQSLKQEKVFNETRVREVRESETYTHSVADGRYKGTAASIAQLINSDTDKYSWFTDKVSLDDDYHIDDRSLSEAFEVIKKTSLEKALEFDLDIPDDLCSYDDFDRYCSEERDVNDKLTKLSNESSEWFSDLLNDATNESLASLLELSKECVIYISSLIKSNHSWVKDALNDSISDNKASLIVLRDNTGKLIEDANKIPIDADKVTIEYPKQYNLQSIILDIEVMHKHLANGGKLGWGPFRARIISERKYLLDSIKVNGRVPKSADTFGMLLSVLSIHSFIEKAHLLWIGRWSDFKGSFDMQLATLTSLSDTLAKILYVSNIINDIRLMLKDLSHSVVLEPDWLDLTDLNKFCNLIEYTMTTRQARALKFNLTYIVEHPVTNALSQNNVHPILQDLHKSIENRNTKMYKQILLSINQIKQQANDYNEACMFLARLGKTYPDLSDSLFENLSVEGWEQKIDSLKDAWLWSQAKTWIEDYIGKADIVSINERITQIEDEINEATTKLASLLAWSCLFERLTESHSRHMIAWQQAMKRFGKGTGRNAPHHRRAAQEHLNDCREAVPAWVMPLHRIWDTIKPLPEMFDLIIIDEASQCGFEAIPLFYIGKKLLIVGDDKQISPEAVGVSQDIVRQLIGRHLYDFEFKDSFNITESLFDQAKLRYGKHQITLREHFRCMPEIIRFSNDLCYNDTPLIPLRQYGSERLNPLESVYVRDGYREGNDSKVINRQEAKRIAEKIQGLCKDDRYKKKTLGVIVLQGEAQAGLIEQEILKLVDISEIEERRLICGNPYSFQGDERDVILLSLVAATNARIGSFTSAADERRFNVAASRAKDQMWLFHSVQQNDLSPNDLRRRLLDFFTNPPIDAITGLDTVELQKRAYYDNRSIVRPPKPFDSWFEIDVALEMAKKDFEVIPQFNVAGKRIDLVVEGGCARLAVECDGDEWHGIDDYETDMHRQRQLERCGWEFFRIRESLYYANKTEALSGLWKSLDDKGIMTMRKRQGKLYSIDDDSNTVEEQDDNSSITNITLPKFHDVPSEENKNNILEELTKGEICGLIIKVLQECPNNSCTLQSLPTKVLAELKVITRSKPRKLFEERVIECLNYLIVNDKVSKYKATNWRVKLVY